MKLFSLCLILLGLMGCQDSSHQDNPQGTIQVKVPIPDGDSYKMGLLNVSTLKSITTLEGEAAHFIYSPRLEHGKVVGYSPRIRTLKNKDGVYVAEDTFSLELLSLYATFEHLMKMDERLGVKDVNSWPPTVAVRARMSEAHGASGGNNARYSGQLDVYLFENFTLPDLPLAVNAGVVGHEHFHSLFYKMVLQKLGGVYGNSLNASPHDVSALRNDFGIGEGESGNANQIYNDDQIYQLSLLRGINEGLADVWGWAFSGDTNFVARSLKFETERNLKLDPRMMYSSVDWSRDVTQFSNLTYTQGYSYKLGSIIAKTVYHASEAQSSYVLDLRLQAARGILKSLPELLSTLRSLKPGERLEPSVILEILSNQIPGLSDAGCDVFRDSIAVNRGSKVCQGRGLPANTGSGRTQDGSDAGGNP